MKASIKLVGSKGRASARDRGKVRVRLNTRSRVKRGARVEVRYVSGNVRGRTIVRLGRTVPRGVGRPAPGPPTAALSGPRHKSRRVWRDL